MCPLLSSNSLDIECCQNGNYANCSNPSLPDTIKNLSCKPTCKLRLINGQEVT